MHQSRAAVGQLGEDLATAHLRASGLQILDRNWRCGSGELDIIAMDGDVVVICEVKTRSTDAFGQPVAAVGADKARRLRRLAAQWLREHPTLGGPVRFDVVGVLLVGGRQPVIDHRRGVLG